MAKKGVTRKSEMAPRPRTAETGVSPWAEMERWLESAGRLGWMKPGMWEWLPHPGSLAAFRGTVPKVDVIDRDAEVVVRAEFPGVAKENLDISVSHDSVTLRAHTTYEEEEEEGEYHRREMSYGQYQRTVPLPQAVDGEKARASFKDGVLELTLPKVEISARKTVKVD